MSEGSFTSEKIAKPKGQFSWKLKNIRKFLYSFLTQMYFINILLIFFFLSLFSEVAVIMFYYFQKLPHLLATRQLLNIISTNVRIFAPSNTRTDKHIYTLSGYYFQGELPTYPFAGDMYQRYPCMTSQITYL